ncbi:hypothetical protein [Saccharothrix sp.]|uniref:hypothetical protein n=1 Tax=Saccharothrix sp. TaxID=1873460 RepID=UPI0028110472|nr:hypothetical protein [Saccharothrix sp.]
MTTCRVAEAAVAALDEAGLRWGEPGSAGPATRGDATALRLWCDGDPARVLAALRAALGGAVVGSATRFDRRRHVALAVRVTEGLALVDVTTGDFMVGPVLVVPAAEVTVDDRTATLTGQAAVADAVVRPLVEGRVPDRWCLAAGRRAWRALPIRTREDFLWRMRVQLGRRFSAGLAVVLDGWNQPRRALVRAARAGMAGMVGSADPAPPGLGDRLLRPVRRGPLDLDTRGVVVAVVGIDADDRARVAAELAATLVADGCRTRTARFTGAAGRTVTPAGRVAPGGRGRLGANHAIRHVWRHVTVVAAHRWLGGVVISDGWPPDPRTAPRAGTPAARAIERAVRPPDVVVVVGAPDGTVAVADGTLVVDPSIPVDEAVADVADRVLEIAHRVAG